MRVSRIVAAFVAGLLALSLPPIARAQQGGNSKLHRWGVGWDDGIGMRYLMSEKWGLGLRVKPAIRDQSRDEERFVITDTSSTHSKRPDHTSRSRDFTVSAMLFHSARISRHVGVGPYFGVGFERKYSRSVDELAVYDDVEYYSWRKTTTNVLFLEVGLRPTFEFFERFVLETRIGVVIQRRDDNYVNFDQNGSYEYESRDKYTTWSVSSFGRDIGPGAVMQFMIYF